MSVRAAAVPTALAAALLAGCAPASDVAPGAPPGPRPASTAVSVPAPSAPVKKVGYPASGSGTYVTAPAEPAGKRTGDLLRYRVVVEKEIKGVTAVEFADAVHRTLGDPRGWTAGGDLSFRRVGRGEPPAFTVHLVTPGTRDLLCQDDGNGYTSCRNGAAVVINVARWVKGVPKFPAGLDTYRQYVINHEVGHVLGHGHELCPGKGKLAPVMQQQTLGMHGCRTNPWPYHRDELYTGVSGQYDDDIPRREGAAKP